MRDGGELAARLPGRLAAPVVLASTHERVLEIVPLAALKQHSVDVPEDASALDGDR